MVVINAYSVSSTSYTQDVFGGNILATRDTLGEGSSFERVAEQLNITSFRYPGGSISEHYFDITNPNATSAPHINGVDTVNLLGLGEFFGFLEENGYGASLVIPTRTYLSEATDVQGNRFAAVDEEALRGFINDVLDGVYGLVSIDAFEIGNEYWNSGGMTSLEYGRVATEMCAIIHDALANHPSYEARFSTPRVLVQMGADYGYADLETHYADVGDGAAQLAAFNADYGFSFGDEYIYGSGKVKWSLLANEIIIREFENSSSLDNVDGVVAHVYSRGPELPSSRYFSVRTIDNSWGNYIDDLFVHITEWNQSASTRALHHEEDFGLLQAHEMLNILEVFADYEVGCARVWPLQQNTANDLSGDVGQSELTVPGHMFALMSEHLLGTRPIQLIPNTGQSEDEVSVDGADIHAFYAVDRLVMFVASTSESGTDLTMDLGQLITDEIEVSVTILGVADGQNPTDTSSTAELISVDSDLLYQDQRLSLNLDSYEIALIEINGPTYTAAFNSFVADSNVDADRTLQGSSGNDSLYGGDGHDTLLGGDGDDFIFGGETDADVADVAYGGRGDDSIDGGYGNDELRGDDGADTIVGGYGADTIIGGAGDDVLTGQAWSDLLVGGDGNDFLNGGFGYDRLQGGEGADYFFHLGVRGHGSDWVQDYDTAEGDVLAYGGNASLDQFQVNFAETANSGIAGVQEAFVIYRPTEQILWALVDGAALDEIDILINDEIHNLL